MEKVEIKRLIISILLFILSTACAVIGIMKYYEGYGKYGKIRKELMPLIDTFNSTDEVKKNKDSIWAEYNNDSIRIHYVDKTTNLKYDFKYIGQSDIKYLKLVYNKNESTYVEKLAKELIESISILNGNNYGDVFKEYQYSDFYTTTLSDGIKVTRNGLDVTLEIVVNINLIDSLKDKFINANNSVNYISSSDLRNLMADIEKNSIFELSKENISLYVSFENNNYNIYVSEKSNNSDRIYESIMSVIYILDNGLYENAYNNKEKFDKDTDNYYYTVVTKAEPIGNLKGNNITKITIKNKSN